jgi:hydrogenase maturation protein HypF
MRSGGAPLARRRIVVNGLVQGVGFRPFVHRAAARLGLGGFVRNQTGGVVIEVEGSPAALDEFVHDLGHRAPALAQVERLRCAELAVRGEPDFRIHDSALTDGTGEVVLSPDLATCDDCLHELADPSDRRYRHPFLNCTNCGPRLTIIKSAPYDRERTTMARFAMCDACRSEYRDPSNRRFHAQPTACPACGPRLQVCDGNGVALDATDPIAYTAARLRAGDLAAVKGIGGYHLACDARNHDAVLELRRRKLRDAKPFALLVADADGAAQLGHVGAAERALLESPARPIVLLSRRADATDADAADATVSPAIAPGMAELGIMLPYSPLHHLLARAFGAPLVLTSGNRSDEPIAHDDDDARQRLAGIADFFLRHDRPIHLRADDSVVRVAGGRPLWLRRSRGRAPLATALPLPLPLDEPTLALGGQLKTTFALGEQRRVCLSHHLGDLDDYATHRQYLAAIEHYERIFRIAPRRLAHDLHPDYASTRVARERAAAEGLALVGVQHHHAHFASCLCEHGVSGPAIGVIFDGSGFGSDGAIWGGEFLAGDASAVVRAAHLAYVPMPGGERAIVEPWRMALAHLRHAGCGLSSLEPHVAARELGLVETALARRINAPATSSIGRLFDAAAAIAGVCRSQSFEGEAAMRLEALASHASTDGHYPFAIGGAEPRVIDPAPLIDALAADVRRGVAPATIARRFHSAIVELVVAVCVQLRDALDLHAVALSGGCFCNAILSRECAERLGAAGFRIYRHHEVPPNDGGLSLGQLAVAAARDHARKDN